MHHRVEHFETKSTLNERQFTDGASFLTQQASYKCYLTDGSRLPSLRCLSWKANAGIGREVSSQLGVFYLLASLQGADNTRSVRLAGTVLNVLHQGNQRSSVRTTRRIQATTRRLLMAIFDEPYIVVAVERQHLTLQGILSGKIVMIANTPHGGALTQEDYPLGQLIALTDPSIALPN